MCTAVAVSARVRESAAVPPPVMVSEAPAFAVCTEHASLRSVGVLANRFLLGVIAFPLAFSALLIYAPPLHGFFGTAALSPAQLVTVTPFPFIVWSADEVRRPFIRRRGRAESTRRELEA